MTTLRPDEAEPARTTRQSPTSDSTTAGAFTIPTISLTQSRQKIAAALREASLTSGFFQLSDIESYIAPTLVIQMFEQTELFFALPDAEKQKVNITLLQLHRVFLFSLSDDLTTPRLG